MAQRRGGRGGGRGVAGEGGHLSSSHRAVLTSQDIIEACLALGFASAGVCEAAPTAREAEYRRWLGAGCHGEMSWLEDLLDRRLDVRRLIEGREVRSVIMVADQYAERGSIDPPAGPSPDTHGRIARYARGRDYHTVVRRRLHRLADRLRRIAPGEEFRSFVDTGPVLEREHAARAGLGFIGKHTLLIDPRRGSYIVLGGMATTLALEPTGRGESAGHCGTCTRCIDACPTGAIEPYSVDARRCISYLTIEHEGSIDPGLQGLMGEWLFGCDVCQQVCPFNEAHGSPVTSRVNPLYRARPGLESGCIPVDEVLGWSEADRRVRLTVSAGKRATLAMMKRNAGIVGVNAARPQDTGDDPEARTSRAGGAR